MNEYLVNLLLKIHNHRMNGGNYVYKPENFTNPEDALREEDGLLELKEMRYIEIAEQRNLMGRKIIKFLIILVKDITYKGNNFIREHLAKENIKPLEETIKDTQDIYQQTQSHLKQARQHIFSIDNERSRKDALRDCLSAMEALVKYISGENDIKPSTKYLKDNNYGPDIIVKDGLSIWDRIHNLYPDIRHGSATVSNLTESEALYWIERILTFVNYLYRIKRNGN